MHKGILISIFITFVSTQAFCNDLLDDLITYIGMEPPSSATHINSWDYDYYVLTIENKYNYQTTLMFLLNEIGNVYRVSLKIAAKSSYFISREETNHYISELDYECELISRNTNQYMEIIREYMYKNFIVLFETRNNFSGTTNTITWTLFQ
jgi:hypothetical protein